MPIDGQGGLARVATLKQDFAKAGRTPFLVIGGDFLAPSVASSVFKGEHMIAALNAAVAEGLATAKLQASLADLGAAPMPMTVAEFGKFVADETEKWAKVVKFANIKLG